MIGKELIKNNSERLDYNFIFKPLESTAYYDDGYTYSMTQLELRFSRTEKSKNQIFGGYYAGTLTFASLFGLPSFKYSVVVAYILSKISFIFFTSESA